MTALFPDPATCENGHEVLGSHDMGHSFALLLVKHEVLDGPRPPGAFRQEVPILPGNHRTASLLGTALRARDRSRRG